MSQESPSCGHTLNFDNLTFTADELRDLNELVVTAVLEAPPLTAFHTLVTGIKNDKHIGIIPGTFGLLLKAAQGCDPVPNCYEDVAIQKTWTPHGLEFITDICITDLINSLLRFYIDCRDPFDLTKTQIFTFIQDLLSKDFPKEVLRYAWFGDTNAALVPAGVLTPGQDVTFWNVFDGFWVQMAAIYAANPLQVQAMPGNNQLTYALQDTVATPLLTMAAVNALIDAAIPELEMQPDKVLLVTRSVFQRLRRQLQALGTAFQDYKLMINGIEFANWDGIQMYSIPLWDSIIRAYENDTITGRWNDPHRVVFTTKSNLNIGMTCNSLFENINSFYDQTTRKNRIEAYDSFDAKIIDDRLLMVGR